MSIISSFLLGILQGLTEFLPISSSGHLVLAQHFFGITEGEDILFEIFLHLGTLFAVLVFFRKRIWDLLVSLLSWKNTLSNQTHRHNRNLILYLTVSTIATGIVYLFFGDVFEALYAEPLIVSFMLLITGAIVFASDYIKSSEIPASQMGLIRSCIIGLMQGVAIIPGISRSGSTIAVSIITGLKRREAAEYSFLLSVPAILGANLISINKFADLSLHQLGVYMCGFATAFAFGYLVISFLIQLISKARLKYFSFYCWGIGLISIILLVWQN